MYTDGGGMPKFQSGGKVVHDIKMVLASGFFAVERAGQYE